ncbi:ABC transporter ATP-binding protein [Thermocatellispora tengchongensis]|uniref:ABC transporter ATP-binding protein n=1 Tax=Thermocatellispora tengchongensis TaxID=1073253 RepID=UPI00363C8407
MLSVRGACKRYGTREIFADINIDVTRGSVLTVVGPSGAGKTTLLRCIAGLLEPSAGEILLDGEPVREPPEKLAVVFQDYSRSLMPWMSVRANVELPLRGKGVGKKERRRRAHAALADVGLETSADLYPWQLSGGMQQRVAIARALAYGPEALLMDEPFASVDAQTRSDLEDLVLDLRDRLGITVVLVTHDIDEAVYLGDTVVVLGGRPTRVDKVVKVPFGRDRDQAGTKARPDFIDLRTRVLERIRQARD